MRNAKKKKCKIISGKPKHRRGRPESEDEALARRLQEQWLSEDSAGRGGGGMFAGGGAQVTDV